MHKLHKELVLLIQKEVKRNPNVSKQSSTYHGHSEKSYHLSSPQLRNLTKSWVKAHQDINFDTFIKLVTSLYENSKSSTEKTFASNIIEYLPRHRSNIDPIMLDKWLDNLSGWGQVDSLCQSRFSVDDMKSKWSKWKSTISKLNKSNNINKRRASLVLLTRPVREVDDRVFTTLAIKNIDSLKHEKDILITKAISWLLREMVKKHKPLVQEYVDKNKDSLPKLAVREVTRKLETGKK